MPVKLIGSLLLVTTGIFLAFMICQYHRRRLQTIDGILAMIFYIKGQVDCYARTLKEILSTLPPEICRDCNCLTGVGSFEEMIGECRIYLDEESLRLFTAFAAEFGSTFREEQVRRCEHYISLFNARREQIAVRTQAESRVGSAVCICMSLCLMILLW